MSPLFPAWLGIVFWFQDMSSSSRLFVFLLRASGHIATAQGAAARPAPMWPCLSLHLLLSRVLPHISQPLYLSLFCPDLPELAAHIGRLEFISGGFDLCKDPSVRSHSPVPPSGRCLRVLLGTLQSPDSRSNSHSTSMRTKWTSEHVCSLTYKRPRSRRLVVVFISSPNCTTYGCYQVGHVNRNYIL